MKSLGMLGAFALMMSLSVDAIGCDLFDRLFCRIQQARECRQERRSAYHRNYCYSRGTEIGRAQVPAPAPQVPMPPVNRTPNFTPGGLRPINSTPNFTP